MIALGTDTTWMMWHDGFCLMARRWDGAAWVEAPAGSADVTTCGVLQNSGLDIADPHIIVDATDRVWSAWSSDCDEYNVYAGSWDGTAWSVVGRDICEPGLAPRGGFDGRLGHHSATGLFLSSLGRDDSVPGLHIYVHHWDGAAWSGLAGSDRGAGISGDGGAPTRRARVAVDSRGRPWVTWSARATNSWQVYALVYDGSAWVEVGGSGSGLGISASTGHALDPTIVVDGHDRPVVFWSDRASGAWEIYARYWTGSVWQELSGSTTAGGVSNSSAPSAEASAIIMRGDQACVVWSEPDRDDREIRGRCLTLPVFPY